MKLKKIQQDYGRTKSQFPHPGPSSIGRGVREYATSSFRMITVKNQVPVLY
jgi:hypothetical protein